MAYLDRRHYQLLLAIQKHGRLSLAAQALGLTQSAASHQIREAERRLAIRFLTYEGRNIALTPAAERLVKAGGFAEGALKLAEADAARIYQGAVTGLRIAVGFYDHTHWLAAAVIALRKAFKDLRVDIVTMDEKNLRMAVIAGTADLFIGLDEENSNIPAVPLFSDRLVHIGPVPSERSASQSPALLRPLQDLAFSRHALLPHQADHFGTQAKPASLKTAMRRILKVESARAIVEMVAANMGTSVLPRWCVAPDLATGRIVELTAVTDNPAVTWYLYGELTQLSQGERILETLVASLRATFAGE